MYNREEEEMEMEKMRLLQVIAVNSYLNVSDLPRAKLSVLKKSFQLIKWLCCCSFCLHHMHGAGRMLQTFKPLEVETALNNRRRKISGRLAQASRISGSLCPRQYKVWRTKTLIWRVWTSVNNCACSWYIGWPSPCKWLGQDTCDTKFFSMLPILLSCQM